MWESCTRVQTKDLPKTFSVAAGSYFMYFDPELSNSKSKSTLAPQPAITCSKLTIEKPEQGVKYIQS